MFRRWTNSIKIRILGMLGALAVGYLLLLAMVQLTASSTHGHLEQVSTSLLPAALGIQQAEASFEEVKKAYKEAVLLEDPAALVAADRTADHVQAALDQLRLNTAGWPDLQSSVNDLCTRFAGIRDRSRDTYPAMVASRQDFSTGLQAQAASLASDDQQFTASLQELDQRIEVQFRNELGAIEAWSRLSRTAGWFMLTIAFAVFGLGWYVTHFKVVLPLERLASSMQSIAKGGGNLTDRVEVHGSNEIDEVGRWFNVFIERVEEIVIRVSRNGRALAVSARDLAEIARENAAQSLLQQDRATGITASMNDISTAVQDISKTTRSAEKDARQAEQNAHSGGETINSTVRTIQKVLTASQATASRIEDLGHAGQAIGKVIHVIDEIADQTNLLALNASIEAARAGEHGRGFAVVAGEVRRLADRTRNATREIDQTVRAIQEGTSEAVEAMRTSMQHVETGVDSARSAGDALARIIQDSGAVQQMVTHIANATAEQSAATQSVHENLTEISKIGVSTTSSSARAVRACDHLSSLADDLNALVGAFKIRRDTGDLESRKLPRSGKESELRDRWTVLPNDPAPADKFTQEANFVR